MERPASARCASYGGSEVRRSAEREGGSEMRETIPDYASLHPGYGVNAMQLDRQAAFTGTKEVAEALKFPVAPLETYLADKVAGFAGPLTVRQFKGGQSNPTYLLETPARRYVLRRKPPGKLLPSAHAVDREFRAISGLYPQGYPVAEPVIYCEDAGLIGTAFYVMSYVEGRGFWEPDMPQSNPAERAAVYDAMNATLARLHSFDPAAIGLSTFGRGENYVARQVD